MLPEGFPCRFGENRPSAEGEDPVEVEKGTRDDLGFDLPKPRFAFVGENAGDAAPLGLDDKIVGVLEVAAERFGDELADLGLARPGHADEHRFRAHARAFGMEAR